MIIKKVEDLRENREILRIISEIFGTEFSLIEDDKALKLIYPDFSLIFNQGIESVILETTDPTIPRYKFMTWLIKRLGLSLDNFNTRLTDGVLSIFINDLPTINFTSCIKPLSNLFVLGGGADFFDSSFIIRQGLTTITGFINRLIEILVINPDIIGIDRDKRQNLIYTFFSNPQNILGLMMYFSLGPNGSIQMNSQNINLNDLHLSTEASRDPN